MSAKNFHAAFMVVIAVFCMAISSNCQAEIRFLIPHNGHLVNNESSEECLSCHAGVVKEVGFQRLTHSAKASQLNSHPIDVPYPVAGWLSKHPTFASESKVLLSGLRLKDGKVTCITCHDLRFQGRPHYLLIPLKDNKLCGVCHTM